MALQQEQLYTIKDIYAFPDGQRAELIDGRIYQMAPPARIHQKLVSELAQQIGGYSKARGGDCEIYPAPIAVFLDKDDKTYVKPDLSIICDKGKLNDRGCNGVPDWIIEIISPSTQQMDYGIKLFKYRMAGVREYWIVNPVTRIVNIYDFENWENTGQHRFEDEIEVCIYKDLRIKIADFIQE